MPRLRQVPRAEAPADVQTVYDMLFGGRCPVAEPGTATALGPFRFSSPTVSNTSCADPGFEV